MSNKIWIFGDSFSTPFDEPTLGIFAQQYIKWKGYTPKTFGDLLGEELGLDVVHLAKGGTDNDTIFESVYQSAPLIQKGDIVIIGWSFIGRFRLGNKSNGFTTIIPNFKINESIDFISPNTIDEILINRSFRIWVRELYNRCIFLNWLFKDMKLIQWTPFLDSTNTKLFSPTKIDMILNETNRELEDGHYSEKGHRELTEVFLELINDDRLRNEISSHLIPTLI